MNFVTYIIELFSFLLGVVVNKNFSLNLMILIMRVIFKCSHVNWKVFGKIGLEYFC